MADFFLDLLLEVFPDLDDLEDFLELEADFEDLVDLVDFVGLVVVAVAVPTSSNDAPNRAIDLRIRRSKRKRSTSGEIYEFLNNGVIVTAR